MFVDILGFATGANEFDIQYTTNVFSQYNPFPNSEIMLRGFGGPGINGTGGPGDGQIRAQQGAMLAAFSTNLSAPHTDLSFPFAMDAVTPFERPTMTSGTFELGA